jgi:hypothetical protein
MEMIDLQSSAVARLHLQTAIRRDGDSVTLNRSLNVYKQAMVMDSLRMLGFDLETENGDFEVPPARMAADSSTLVLTKTGLERLYAVLKEYPPQ